MALTAPACADEWPRSTPAQLELDAQGLDALVRDLREGRLPYVRSLLVARHGRLAVEEYAAGVSPDDLQHLQSVTKTVTSALIGIAVERGLLSLDESVVDVLEPFHPTLRFDDARKRSITIEHLLTMRSGTGYHERGFDSPHSRLNQMASGWPRYYLDLPMLRDPGTHFQYDSGGVILLSSILHARSGLHADAFAEKYLFGPLGISNVRWFRNREGHPHTGGGLWMRPRDVAKVGQLYLQGGRWEGRQVVPASWVARSTSRQVRLERPTESASGYGYLWWIRSLAPGDAPNGDGVISAEGFQGQYLFLVPSMDLVVVVTSKAPVPEQDRPIEFLYTHILGQGSVPAAPAP
ncbi:MAG: serine hydrolase [Myxococcota bacterium]